MFSTDEEVQKVQTALRHFGCAKLLSYVCVTFGWDSTWSMKLQLYVAGLLNFGCRHTIQSTLSMGMVLMLMLLLLSLLVLPLLTTATIASSNHNRQKVLVLDIDGTVSCSLFNINHRRARSLLLRLK